ELGDRWPRCAPDLTEEVATGLFAAQAMYNLKTAPVAEELRVQAYRAMADLFEQVDFVIAATNPDLAFPADAPTSNPTDSFLDAARGTTVARVALRGTLAAVRFVAAAFPNVPSAVLGLAAQRLPDLVSMGAL